MRRKVVAISMPPRMLEWIRERVEKDDEFASVSDYMRELVLNDQARIKALARWVGHDFEALRFPGSTSTARLR